MSSRIQFTASVARVLRSGLGRYLAWRTRRATRAILQSLEDRTLRDIGLHRSEIESTVHHMAAALSRR